MSLYDANPNFTPADNITLHKDLEGQNIVLMFPGKVISFRSCFLPNFFPALQAGILSVIKISQP